MRALGGPPRRVPRSRRRPSRCRVSRETAPAELIADRGEAAASEEFFRSRPFLDAEGVTHTLRIGVGEGELLAPLVVRPIGESPALDASSPYGYPGIAAPPGVALDPAAVDFGPTGLVSFFL